MSSVVFTFRGNKIDRTKQPQSRNAYKCPLWLFQLHSGVMCWIISSVSKRLTTKTSKADAVAPPPPLDKVCADCNSSDCRSRCPVGKGHSLLISITAVAPMGGQEATSFVLLSYTVLYLRDQINESKKDPQQTRGRSENKRQGRNHDLHAVFEEGGYD